MEPMPNLVKLNLSSNYLREFPEVLCGRNFPALTYLDLKWSAHEKRMLQKKLVQMYSIVAWIEARDLICMRILSVAHVMNCCFDFNCGPMCSVTATYHYTCHLVLVLPSGVYFVPVVSA